MLTMPDVLVIDIPERFAASTLPLGRYYPILLENSHELAEAEGFLARQRPELVLPDLFDRRPSAAHSACVIVARYRPPTSGWPWLLVCLWPAAYTCMVSPGSDLFARGAYTSEVYETRDDMIEGEARLRASFTDQQIAHVIGRPINAGSA
jgi:hypothetical protein